MTLQGDKGGSVSGKVLVSGTLLVTLLNCGGLVYLFLQSGNLRSQMDALESRLEELSGTWSLELISSLTQDARELAEQKNRNRRSHHNSGTQGEAEDSIMMMTYSMIPVSTASCSTLSNKGINECLVVTFPPANNVPFYISLIIET